MHLLPTAERTKPRATRDTITDWLLARIALWVDNVVVEVHVKTVKPIQNAIDNNAETVPSTN